MPRTHNGRAEKLYSWSTLSQGVQAAPEVGKSQLD